MENLMMVMKQDIPNKHGDDGVRYLIFTNNIETADVWVVENLGVNSKDVWKSVDIQMFGYYWPGGQYNWWMLEYEKGE